MREAMTLHCADAVKWANEYQGSLHHALLCDPPYHLTSITKRFGKDGSAPAQYGTDGVYSRASAGFMGQEWDGGDVAFRPETWEAFSRVLYPGAFGMAFASSRGFHRMAVAIEDAGFILHPFICWTFSTGFPKATRIDTQIDRQAKVERQPIGIAAGAASSQTNSLGRFSPQYPLTEPATDLARTWAGHRYGLQALKPAVEPILVFQKPYEGRPLDCITRTGAGALNIEAGRIGSAAVRTNGGAKFPGLYGTFADCPESVHNGRWPANLVLQGSAVEMIDRQSGTTTSKSGGYSGTDPGMWSACQTTFRGGHDDSGGASRFFFQVQEAIDCADPVLYRAKSGRAERDAGLEDFIRTVKPAWEGDTRPNRDDGTTGIGNSGVQAVYRNPHPCLKPLSLCKYLASLLLPPLAYAPRRLYVPFSGVASEVTGADLAGWEEVNGVEMNEEYCRIGEARRRFWSCNSGLFDSLCEQPEEAGDSQGNLFAEDTP